MSMRRGSRRIRAPDENAGGIAGGPWIEADLGVAVHVLERNVAGLVADRVRIDFGGAEAVEEPKRKEEGEERERARVVGVQDRVPAGVGLDSTETLGDLPERLVPGDRLERRVALWAGPTKRPRESGLGVEEGAVVADRALAAELAAGHGVIGIAADMADRAVTLDDDDAAGVVAVPRTRRQD